MATQIDEDVINDKYIFAATPQIVDGWAKDGWSGPVQFRFYLREDGQYDLVIRTWDEREALRRPQGG